MTLVRPPLWPHSKSSMLSLPVSLDPNSAHFPSNEEFFGQSETIPAAYTNEQPILQAPPDIGHLYPTIKKIERMAAWQDGWNGDDALAPSPQTLANAVRWVLRMFVSAHAASRHSWIYPHVTASADGEVVFEWWKGQRKLTVYISSIGAEYVRVWGTNIQDEMSEGDISSPRECTSGWKWLIAQE